ncbi:MAG TPA: acetoacetate--CoA ligase [Candidatus Dormibacteraeota bacterium]|nr:acetoacetate--CoA ligase [Candidatus Dormibacteraeota bacterium]
MEETDDPVEEGQLLWTPSPSLVATSRLSAYREAVEAHLRTTLPDYQSLWEWSTTEIESFWETIWKFFEVSPQSSYEAALVGRTMPGAAWFPGATLNYAEHALRRLAADRECLIAVAETGARRALTGRELRRQVASFASYLRKLGVRPGDRVAAYMPNIPEAVVGLLGCASVGAIWSSCSPDFGERAVLDRFQQIQPMVLLVVDGYRYGGREFDRREVCRRLQEGLPSVRDVVEVPNLYQSGPPFTAGSRRWSEVMEGKAALDFESVPFDHPLWVVYSSGTTGLPKPIVHSQGGILLEHLKALGLHADLSSESRFFWFTTTGWMMWNYLVGGLLLGSTVVLFDGSPGWPNLQRLWQMIDEEKITHFGTSAGHISASMQGGVQPSGSLDLSSLRFLGSTGSPLSPAGFRWVYDHVKEDLWLSSLSGGTDLCTAFLLGCPWLPVRSGVIQCRALGARVEAFDSRGNPLVDEVGELVITQPMPSMPIGFWGDQEGTRYRQSYFEFYPGIWRHGDWVKLRTDGGAVIYGRSDSTINRHGVRMGTAEIYRAVEEMPEVIDSLVVDVARTGKGSYMPLFLVLRDGITLDPELSAAVKEKIRQQVSPRHVPDLVLQVSEIPKTLSGKKLEIPVKRILQGEKPGDTVSLEAVQNPKALLAFTSLAEEHSQ